MSESGKIALDVFYLVVGFTAIILNIFLIVISSKISSHKRDIRMTMVLAVFDMVIPGAAMVALIHNLITGTSIGTVPHGCQIKGPLDFFGISFSMMMVSMIAVERLHLMLSVKVNRLVWGFYGIFAAAYLSLVIVGAVKNEFYMLPNGIDCTPLPSASFVSLAVSGLFALSLFIFLFLTFGCYIAILRKLMRQSINNTEFGDTQRAKAQSGSQVRVRVTSVTPAPRKQVSVAFRIAFITITYFIIVFPSCIMILVDALIYHDDVELVDTVQIVGDVLLSLIALANPCLVLFGHSQMYQKFKDTLWDIIYFFKRR